jgi:hypothetical protein
MNNRIPGLAADVGNVALTYEKYGLTARIAYNFSGEALGEIGELDDSSQDIWVDRHGQLDFSCSYEITKGLEVFTEFSNILNNPFREYYGDRDITYQLEYYSWMVNVGVKWRLL